jgi:hypothetical protein
MTARARTKAVLGPTNTGKTYLAIERMLGHASGMIGLPLRLLAREVYDRVVAAKGEALAALITGEETKSRSRAISIAATSSPSASSTPAASAKPCSSAPTRCAR